MGEEIGERGGGKEGEIGGATVLGELWVMGLDHHEEPDTCWGPLVFLCPTKSLNAPRVCTEPLCTPSFIPHPHRSIRDTHKPFTHIHRAIKPTTTPINTPHPQPNPSRPPRTRSPPPFLQRQEQLPRFSQGQKAIRVKKINNIKIKPENSS